MSSRESQDAKAFRLMKGKILTQIEASFPPGQQCDQLKVLISRHIRDAQTMIETSRLTEVSESDA